MSFIVISNQRVSATPPANAVHHLAPSYWFTGLKDSFLEVIVHAENIDVLEVKMEEYPGVQFLGKLNTANRHIAYLQLIIQPSALPGSLQFSAKPASRRSRYAKAFRFNYQLVAAEKNKRTISSEDIIYRVAMDRFANGNERNDRAPLHHNYKFDAKNPTARHGGDIVGAIAQFETLRNLGVTALWMDGLMENDVPENSYLGYSITNHYQVDPRFGTNAQLEKLKERSRETGMKLCMEFNLNQVGWYHWMYEHFDTGWFHHPDSTIFPFPDPEFLTHPGLSSTEKSWISQHWMDPSLPDLNQQNEHIYRYLKQCIYWWTENAGIEGWIIPDAHLLAPGFTQKLFSEIRRDFPGITFILNTNYSHNMYQAEISSVPRKDDLSGFDMFLDQATFNALKNIALTDTCDKKSLASLFQTQYFYEEFAPESKRILFLDNPKSARIFGLCGTSIRRWKMMQSLFFTLPGTTGIFYGTEFLLHDSGVSENSLLNYPSCRNKNAEDCFKTRSAEEQEAFLFIQKLIQLRSQNGALKHGTTKLFAPADGIFTYFRISGKQKVMVIVNTNPLTRSADLSRYAEYLKTIATVKNLITGESSSAGKTLTIGGQSALILEIL